MTPEIVEMLSTLVDTIGFLGVLALIVWWSKG